MAIKKGASITATTITTAICRWMCSAASTSCAPRLRRRSIDPSLGSVKELTRIVEQIRAAWPQVLIILRGDSGFCRDAVMSWCEQHQVDYVLGMALDVRLEAIVAQALQQAAQQSQQTGKPARVFVEVRT